VIRQALLQQLLNVFFIACGALGLAKRPLIPIKPQPFQAFQNVFLPFGAGTLQIGIFNPENESAAVFSGKQPIKKGGPGRTQMQKSRGGGGDSRADRAAFGEFYALIGHFNL